MLLLFPFVQMQELRSKESLSDSFKGLERVNGRPGFRPRQRHTNNCHAESHFAILVLELEQQPEAYLCHDQAVHLSASVASFGKWEEYVLLCRQVGGPNSLAQGLLLWFQLSS